MYGVGNHKNADVMARIARDGVEVFPGSVRYLQAAVAAGLKRIVVSSSANTALVLHVTGLEQYVEGRIDGVTLAEQHIAGKPKPDSYLAGAKLAGVEPDQAAVFEDALAGVEAGRAGHFGFVVGVDRVGQAAALKAHGADVVVKDLADLLDGADMIPDVRITRSSRGTFANSGSTSMCWPRPSRSSPCRTAISGCAATSTRASRTACPAPI